MKLKSTFLAMSLLSMSSLSYAAETQQYQINYNGQVVAAACMLNGQSFTVNMMPVSVTQLERSSAAVGRTPADGYKVVCDSDISVKLAFGAPANGTATAVDNQQALKLDATADAAKGVLVFPEISYQRKVVDGAPVPAFMYLYTPSSNIGELNLTKESDGVYTSPLSFRGSYIKEKDAATIAAGVVKSSVPFYFVYQ